MNKTEIEQQSRNCNYQFASRLIKTTPDTFQEKLLRKMKDGKSRENLSPVFEK